MDIICNYIPRIDFDDQMLHNHVEPDRFMLVSLVEVRSILFSNSLCQFGVLDIRLSYLSSILAVIQFIFQT